MLGGSRFQRTACEVLCSELDAVHTTLLEDGELMQLLCSGLDASTAPPGSATCVARVLGTLLLRKPHDVFEHVQEHPELLERLVQRVDAAAVAEVLTRLAGADEHGGALPLAHFAPWLADETPLMPLLLARLGAGGPPVAQANAADVLCAIAHAQPSPLARALARPDSVAAMFAHGMAQEQRALVQVLDVWIALLEPRRVCLPDHAAMLAHDSLAQAKAAAVDSMLQHLPPLADLLQLSGGDAAAAPRGEWLPPAALDTPWGVLSPRLGRTRLKVVELLAALLRSGGPAVEAAVVQAGVVGTCLRLFAAFPFNNLLHQGVAAMLAAILTRGSDPNHHHQGSAMLQHVFEHCRLVDWLVSLPADVKPTPVAGQEELAAAKPLVRAGYMGHVAQIAHTLRSLTSQPSGDAALLHEAGAAAHDGEQAAEGGAGGGDGGGLASGAAELGGDAQGVAAHGAADAQHAAAAVGRPGGGRDGGGEGGGAAGAEPHAVQQYLSGSAAWSAFVHDVLEPQQELEHTWQCGRPVLNELMGLDSEGEELQVSDKLRSPAQACAYARAAWLLSCEGRSQSPWCAVACVWGACRPR